MDKNTLWMVVVVLLLGIMLYLLYKNFLAPAY